MSVRSRASLLVGLLICGSVASAQTPPPITGAVIPGPITQRPQTPAPPRDNAYPQAPAGTSVIRGRVTAADSGTPLRRAPVRIAATDVRVIKTASTDSDGRFEFTKLPAAHYTINVMRKDYVTLSFGQRRPFEPGKLLNLADGEVAETIDFALPRGSVIAGRIREEAGDTGFEVHAGTAVTGLEAVLTAQQTTLSSTVRNSRGEVVKDSVIAILPDNLNEGTDQERFIRTVRPDQNGQYQMLVLPAADYVAFAVESLDQGASTILLISRTSRRGARPSG